MNKVIHLSLARKSVPILMDVVQGATAPSIEFVLDDYTPPSNARARIYILKEGGEVYNNCTLSGNVITYTPTAGSFDVPGQCVAQLELVQSSTVAVSWRIFVTVEPNLINGSAAPASTEYNALTQLIVNAQRYDGIIGANNITGYNNRQGWTALTNGQDLNSVAGAGLYYANTDNIAKTLLNCPYPMAFNMIVDINGKQTIMPKLAAYTDTIFYRQGTGSWRSVTNTLYDDVYGLEVDYANSRFIRLGAAAGKSAGADFDNALPFMRKRCNVDDDGVIKAYYGDGDYTEDGSNGQVMVYQPAFYYKVVPIVLEPQATGIGYHSRRIQYYVSGTPHEGFKRHPAFYDGNGNEIPYVLMGAYEACLYDTSASTYITNDAQVMDIATDKLSSIANVKPVSGSTQNLTRPNVETLAQNRGSNWHGSTVKIASMSQLLCMIEMGTMNFQSAIGQGVVSYAAGSGNEASNTGATSSLGNGTGQATQTTHISSNGTETIDTTSGKLSVSYRGLENPWGNIWELEYGVNIWGNGNMAGGEPYVADDFNFAESKRTDNYEGAGFTVTNASGYISAMGYSTRCDWLFMASETAGNGSLPVGDYTYVTPNLNGYRIAQFGGGWGGAASAGGFNWYLGDRVGYRDRFAGGRLVYVPTAVNN